MFVYDYYLKDKGLVSLFDIVLRDWGIKAFEKRSSLTRRAKGDLMIRPTFDFCFSKKQNDGMCCRLIMRTKSFSWSFRA